MEAKAQQIVTAMGCVMEMPINTLSEPDTPFIRRLLRTESNINQFQSVTITGERVGIKKNLTYTLTSCCLMLACCCCRKASSLSGVSTAAESCVWDRAHFYTHPEAAPNSPTTVSLLTFSLHLWRRCLHMSADLILWMILWISSPCLLRDGRLMSSRGRWCWHRWQEVIWNWVLVQWRL